MKASKTLTIKAAVGSAALLLGISFPAFAHAQHDAAGHSSQQQSDKGEMQQHDMKQSMSNMHEKMGNMQMSGDPDHDFAMMMREHHQAGIDMAKDELKNGKDPELQKMAKKVVSDQTKEIAKLDQWMSKHQAHGK